jgi:hydrogenase maturation protease
LGAARNVFEPPRILIAGIGNVSRGDDGFGVAVSKALSTENLPDSVRVADFCMCGFDLAYAMQCGYETAILVDACPSGPEPGTIPGTISVTELDLHDGAARKAQTNFVQSCAMSPKNALRMVANMNGPLRRVLLVECVPTISGCEQGRMALSEPVAAAVPEAVRVTVNLVQRILDEIPGDKENYNKDN